MSDEANSNHSMRMIGFFTGPLLFALTLLLPPPEGMQLATWQSAALAVWMISWWVFEAVPLSVTALLPLVVYPLLGVMDLREAAKPFAEPVIYLFLGGFIIALGIEKSKLHLRIALGIVKLIGTRPDLMIGGFMAATSFLSMWISNTATVIMMLPMALSVIHLLKDQLGEESAKTARNFALCMMLGLAYASGIGGMGTLIGTPPNAFLKGYLEKSYGFEIAFFDWMKFGVPLVIVLTLAMWVILVKIVFRVDMKESVQTKALIHDEIAKLGAMSKIEKIVLSIFLCVAFGWVFQQPLSGGFTLGGFSFAGIPELSDTVIAMIGALAMFLIPLDFKKNETILTWKDAEKLPWGVLILFGGGLSMAHGFETTGLGTWIGHQFDGTGNYLPHLVIVALVVLVTMACTEFMSNIATITMLLPVIVPIAIGMGENPLMFAIPATIIASCAFVLPVSTASNAIVFGTGYVKIQEMVKGGILVNIAAYILVMILAMTLIPAIFDIQQGVLPDWAQPKNTGISLPTTAED